mgnify:CR=1 FL=1
MVKYSDIIFCKLMQMALDLSCDFPCICAEKDWQNLFFMVQQQSVVGVVYNVISHLPQDSRPPRRILLNWSCATEAIQGANRQINQEAARYTRLFMDRGFKSVILKGPANSLLYPDPLSRQAGDVDIWIPGGCEKVERLLLDMNLIPAPKNAYRLSHHIAFRTENGFNIEVHHRPADVAFRNAEFQEVLLAEFDNSILTPEGFYAPSIRFALLMQLVHLYKHSRSEGVGLRHYMDYFVLLTHSTEADREYARSNVKRFKLTKGCAAIMWVLGEVFALKPELMLCPPDEKRGKRLYKQAFEGGNFGHYAPNAKEMRTPLKRWLNTRMNFFRWLTFDPLNTVLDEIHYWKIAFSLLPQRIKQRKVFLGHV